MSEIEYSWQGVIACLPQSFWGDPTANQALQLTMPNYRRSIEAGGTYFFSLKTFDRVPLFSNQLCREILHNAWVDVKPRHPLTQ